jgi:hypothetical protein
MFTLEIGGRPIAVIDTDEEDARELIDSAPFRADLQRLLSEDKPIWDGSAPLTLRAATADEISEFEASDEEDEEEFADDASDEAEDDEEEDEDEDDAAVVLFLVPITDPDDEDEEEA